MPYFEEGSEAMVALEAMVDKAGIRNVLYALEHICGAKAEHLASNWQDSLSAKRWDGDARKIGRAARDVIDLLAP